VGEKDNHLLLIIDMIKKPEIWREFLKVPHLKNFQICEIGKLLGLVQDALAPISAGTFDKTYNRISAIIQEYPDQSTEFYVLAFRLKDPRHIQALERIDLKQIFQWDRNGGLRFRAAKEQPMERLTPDQIIRLHNLIKKNPKKSSEFYILALHLKDSKWIPFFKNLDLKKIFQWNKSGELRFKSELEQPLEELTPNKILLRLYVEIKNQKIDHDQFSRFRGELAQYILDREKERVKSRSEYTGFFGSLTGTAATVKIQAAQKMIDALNGQQVVFDKSDTDALREGWGSKLTGIMNRYERLIPKAFLDAEQVVERREVVRHGLRKTL